ncbi:MAG: gliding motility associated protein GldN [Crocinitomix sp.]|jgi:gliding motility associated protien GldN
MKISVFIAIQFFLWNSYSQINSDSISNPHPGVIDGIYIKETLANKPSFCSYRVINEDPYYYKTVWNTIDSCPNLFLPTYYQSDTNGNENMNESTYSFWNIVCRHIMNGDLTLYSPFNPIVPKWNDGDSFKYPIKSEQIDGDFYNDTIFHLDISSYLAKENFEQYSIGQVLSPNLPMDSLSRVGYLVGKNSEANDTVYFKSEDIIQYRIKEEWYFDQKRSVLDRKIIGIAPLVNQIDGNGRVTGVRELFWLYLPECASIFRGYNLNSSHNNSQNESLQELFTNRNFQSYLIKESNSCNRILESYKTAKDAELESEKINEKIINFEHVLWCF